MIISLESEKAFDKIQHCFMIFKNPLKKLRTEGNFLNLIKDICENPQLTSYLMVKH